jgi:hypothetical protein
MLGIGGGSGAHPLFSLKQVLLLMEHLNGSLDELFDTLVAAIMAEAR